MNCSLPIPGGGTEGSGRGRGGRIRGAGEIFLYLLLTQFKMKQRPLLTAQRPGVGERRGTLIWESPVNDWEVPKVGWLSLWVRLRFVCGHSLKVRFTGSEGWALGRCPPPGR